MLGLDFSGVKLFKVICVLLPNNIVGKSSFQMSQWWRVGMRKVDPS